MLQTLAADTRKLTSLAAFQKATADSAETPGEPGAAGRGGSMSLRTFADQRRAYLLNHPEIKKLAPKNSAPAEK